MLNLLNKYGLKYIYLDVLVNKLIKVFQSVCIMNLKYYDIGSIHG